MRVSDKALQAMAEVPLQYLQEVDWLHPRRLELATVLGVGLRRIDPLDLLLLHRLPPCPPSLVGFLRRVAVGLRALP